MKVKYYEMTWYSKENLDLEESVQQAIRECIVKAGKTLEVRIEVQKMTMHSLTFGMYADEHISLNKVLRSLQKKMKPFMTGLQDSPCVVSFPNGKAKGDGRLKKIIKEICDVGYYDLNEYFSGDLTDFKKYLGERELGVIEYKERMYLVDLENLKHKINLNCFECTKKHQYGCCCGSPCDMSRHNKDNFDVHEAAIAEEVKALDAKEYQMIKETGGFVFLDGTINECNGHCALLVHHEGTYKCIAHKYALENNIPIYTLCPLSCLMYPLEMMTLFTNNQQKRIVLLTSVVEEAFASAYGRWGSYHSLDVELRCINVDAHNEVFKAADYKAVYEVNKGLLIHELGNEIFSSMQHLCEVHERN